MKTIWNFFQSLPTHRDALLLSAFTIVITFQPFYLQGQINIFEVGLYLPGINGILHGLVPYRDFFHLRGPFELYMPAWMMTIFGKNIAVLSAYFYLGTILTLVACVFLAREIFKTRFMLYLMVPVLVARTFPRVVFTYWGGMRYAWGILALWCAIKYFKRKKSIWILWAGIGAACGLLTSVEIGVASIVSILGVLTFSHAFKLQERKTFLKTLGMFLGGIAAVGLPYLFYLLATGSLYPFIESVYTVVFSLPKVINNRFASVYPTNLAELITAMVIPTGENFRHMTPLYTYVFYLVYLCHMLRQKKTEAVHWGLLSLTLYGGIIFYAAISNLWGARHEMALQPEKIVLFFIFERVYLLALEKRHGLMVYAAPVGTHGKNNIKVCLINALIFCFIVFSIGYSIDRYNKRFFAVKFLKNLAAGRNMSEIKPLAGDESRALTIERAKGMVVPSLQANELETVVHFIQENTKPGEIVFMYPELGAYSFFIDRPFLGRFPMATFSWLNENWHKELFAQLTTLKPRVAVVAKSFFPDQEKIYFSREENRKKYDEVMGVIRANYNLVLTAPESYIYVLKPSR